MSSRFSKQIICEAIHFWLKFKYKIDYLPKIGVCYFSYHPSIAASETRILTTLVSTKIRGEINSHKKVIIPLFQTASRNKKTSFLLYTCEVIYLINKGVISLYVQKQGGILLKFNILCLHYVTHYCAKIKC